MQGLFFAALPTSSRCDRAEFDLIAGLGEEALVGAWLPGLLELDRYGGHSTDAVS
ncbi:MAG: hypothetical protein ABJL35_03155 [Parasphingorhabdus sp.]|uniref:hypothetical protein n=1 Tax=Parasphingorhabdus sp. TaxID=2709688 RepID=UPI0032992B98